MPGPIRWVTLNQKNTVAGYNHTPWATSRISLLFNLFAKSLSEINCSRKTDLTEKNLLDTTVTDCLHWYIILEVSEHHSFIRQRPPPSCKGDVMGMLHHTSPVYSHRCYRFPHNFWQEECKTKHMNSGSALGFHLNCYGSICTVSSAKLQMSCNIQPFLSLRWKLVCLRIDRKREHRTAKAFQALRLQINCPGSRGLQICFPGMLHSDSDPMDWSCISYGRGKFNSWWTGKGKSQSNQKNW